MAVFSELFPLQTPYAQRFECCEANPILNSFEVFTLWWVEECKLGIILADPYKVVHSKMGDFEVRFLSAKTCHAFKFPVVLIK